MKIGIPVKCQNGHKATWVVEFSGLDVRELGVPEGPEKCDCPKHEIGQGYFPDGAPFVLTIDCTAASRDVLAERVRQQHGEHFKPDRDDQYHNFELAHAAACYALSPPHIGQWEPTCPALWPWRPGWYKPRSRRENLVRAGALILAEIERIDRADRGREVQS